MFVFHPRVLSLRAKRANQTRHHNTPPAHPPHANNTHLRAIVSFFLKRAVSIYQNTDWNQLVSQIEGPKDSKFR